MSLIPNSAGLNDPDGENEPEGFEPDPETELAAKTRATHRVRRLKSNELVSQGDFVGDGRGGLKQWEGPGGFRADAFVKPIYRLAGKQSPAAKTSK